MILKKWRGSSFEDPKKTKKKIHLVSWDTVYLPKVDGGLGIRRLHQMNEAYLMKLAWGVLTKQNDLWV